jgi:hypothetical protein
LEMEMSMPLSSNQYVPKVVSKVRAFAGGVM